VYAFSEGKKDGNFQTQRGSGAGMRSSSFFMLSFVV